MTFGEPKEKKLVGWISLFLSFLLLGVGALGLFPFGDKVRLGKGDCPVPICADEIWVILNGLCLSLDSQKSKRWDRQNHEDQSASSSPSEEEQAERIEVLHCSTESNRGESLSKVWNPAHVVL